MQILISNLLNPHLKPQGSAIDAMRVHSNPIAKDPLLPLNLKPLDGTVDLRGQICSTKLRGVSGRPLSCDELLEKFCDSDLRETRKFICSYNELFDCDVPYILNIVQKMPNCAEVDLSFNRLYGTEDTSNMVDRCIRLMLELPQIKHVVIVGNVLASISRKDFYNQLDELHLSKLIWIPKEWLSGNGWKGVLEKTPLHEIVEMQHRLYWG